MPKSKVGHGEIFLQFNVIPDQGNVCNPAALQDPFFASADVETPAVSDTV